jgi:hypothetical protein
VSVYVDTLVAFAASDPKSQAFRVGARNRHRWCHMIADTLEELHAMAARIGMKREWFQDKGRTPHYDLTPGRRAAAVKAGAIECNRSVFVAHMKRIRGEPWQCPLTAPDGRRCVLLAHHPLVKCSATGITVPA